ncbi:MAG: JDVT-CTERM system glutamic-type intramembrane protease [Burkholderiales bacterium]
MKSFPYKNLFRDKRFIVALIAAPPVWLALYFLLRAPAPSFWFAHSSKALLFFLLPVLVYPVLEEIAFRGLVQETFFAQPWGRKNWLGISAANLATSALFVAAHFFYHQPLWALSVFVPSLVFGFFRDKYNSVIPPILLHMFYNFGYIWLLAKPSDA